MEEWIQEQIKFGRTICLHDENWEPIFKIKLDKYDKSLLYFITSQYNKNNHHLLGDNHAFYGKRLIPMPARFEYTPIEFIDVKGRYEDQVNRDEATKVIDILTNDIKLSVNGSYPSVGIATFNLYQRNLILDEISIKVRIVLSLFRNFI